MPSVEELLQEARRLDLSHTEGRFRLGEIAEELCRALPAVADVLDRLAIDLKVDRDLVIDAWWVAAAFPPTRRPACRGPATCCCGSTRSATSWPTLLHGRVGTRLAFSGNWRRASPSTTARALVSRLVVA